MKSRQIRKIEVKKLFGVYDYNLKLPLDATEDMFILYGDNGTGKSTILRLAYHLLSSEPRRSHRTYLANVVFKSFSVTFDDGIVVSAERKMNNKDLIGDFTMSYLEKGETITFNALTEWDEGEHSFHVSISVLKGDNLAAYNKIISKLEDFNVFYISDRRNEEELEYYDGFRRIESRSKQDLVEKEMESLHDWVMGQVLSANRKGEEGTSEIYVEILSRLGKKSTNEGQMMTLSDIEKELDVLGERTKSYQQMGFVSDAEYGNVKAKLKQIVKKNEEPAANILEPFIEIQKKKLDALDHLFDTVTYLKNSLNDYLYRKQVEYSVQSGFKFYQTIKDGLGVYRHENEIPINKLSSGERQLLRLFSMVIRNSNACPIIIIDEPELSLNIKWQRLLLSTLSYFVRDTKAQFVIATHSFEVLASHTDNTVKIGDY